MTDDNVVSDAVAANKRALLDTVKALVLEQGVPDSIVTKWIKAELLEAVKDEARIPVAYNTCHGGYGLSKHFEAFLASLHPPDPQRDVRLVVVEAALGRPLHKHEAVFLYYERIFEALAMRAYGTHVSATHPHLMGLLACVKRAKRLIYLAEQAVRLEAEADNVVRNAKDVRTQLASPYSFGFADDSPEAGTYAPTGRFLQRDGSMYLRGYTRAAIQAFMDATDVDALVTRTRAEAEALLDSDEWRAAAEEDVRARALAFALRWRGQDKERSELKYNRVSFMDALTSADGKEQAADEGTWWLHQSAYPQAAMCFLESLHRDAPEALATLRDTDGDPDPEKLGLLCASSVYAQLGIAWVAPRVHFFIGEYDGREGVVQD